MNGEASQAGKEVWLKWTQFNLKGDDEPTHEANVRVDDDGMVYVDWYLTAVGQVTSVSFARVEDARSWLEEQGFADYTA